MPIVEPRSAVLVLPVIRGNYDPALTQTVKQRVGEACSRLDINAIFPADDCGSAGLIRSDDDIAAYYHAWRDRMYDIRAVLVVSGDFMRERAIQDTLRCLPADVPVGLIVHNDSPADLKRGTLGDALCGTLSVHANARMIGRRIVRTARIDTADADTLDSVLGEQARIFAGIEAMRNMRVAMFGINPNEFVTTFTNQLKLIELGFSLHTYELITLYGDTVMAKGLQPGQTDYEGPLGPARLSRPIRPDDTRLSETCESIIRAMPNLGEDRGRVDMLARCLLWLGDTIRADRLDAGAIHCWGEFTRFFGCAPCSFAMLANETLAVPVVCEVDICHAIMARLAWAMTGQPGVILDVNNTGWDRRVFAVFHCGQTPTSWLTGPARWTEHGGVEGQIRPGAFTAISAGTSSEAFHATVFHGQMLDEPIATRGSSGWAYVPNLPEVLAQVEKTGIHHFVAMAGHHGPAVAEALRFRGIDAADLSMPVGGPEEIRREVGSVEEAPDRPCRVFSR